MNARMLVPVDGSERSFKALDYAADIAEKHGSTVCLLHVVPDKEMPEGLKRWAEAEHVTDPPEWFYEQAVAEGLLEEAETRFKDRKVGTLERAIEHGDAARRILEVARRRKADVIVMGTRGLSDLQGLAFGSVAHKVMHAAPCTVITVR